MDHQATCFGLGDPILGQESDKDQLPDATHQLAFHNILEARQILERISRDIARFATLCTALSDMQVLLPKHVSITSQISHFAQSFETLRQQAYSSLSPKDKRAADLTQLIEYGLRLTLKTCLPTPPPNDPAISLYTSDFKHIRSLAEAILSRTPKFPSISMDTGIIPHMLWRTDVPNTAFAGARLKLSSPIHIRKNPGMPTYWPVLQLSL
ncbi:hypothetical protein BBP40_005019 [Aspergillus hancockii]|nr:hypothetical protein BBP40_005019 [Aspergillus hancockii]